MCVCLDAGGKFENGFETSAEMFDGDHGIAGWLSGLLACWLAVADYKYRGYDMI